jgi:hypothetical protein
MRLKPVWIAAFAACFFYSSAHAEKIDCDSLAEVSMAINEVIVGLGEGEELDDATYESLSGAMDALHTIADQENDTALDQGLDDLEAAHENDNRDEFIIALDAVNSAFSKFSKQDCGG